jgi:acetyl esterase
MYDQLQANTAIQSADDAMKTGAQVEPASNPQVEHNTRAFLKWLNSGEGAPPEQLSPKEAREFLDALQANAHPSLPPADIEYKAAEQDGLAVSLTIVRPINLKERGPAFLFFHGGGFVLGDFVTHERFVRDLVSDSEITAILSTTHGRPRHNILWR